MISSVIVMTSHVIMRTRVECYGSCSLQLKELQMQT